MTVISTLKSCSTECGKCHLQSLLIHRTHLMDINTYPDPPEDRPGITGWTLRGNWVQISDRNHMTQGCSVCPWQLGKWYRWTRGLRVQTTMDLNLAHITVWVEARQLVPCICRFFTTDSTNHASKIFQKLDWRCRLLILSSSPKEYNTTTILKSIYIVWGYFKK